MTREERIEAAIKRREAGKELIKHSLTPSEVMERFGVSRVTEWRWRSTVKEKGLKGLQQTKSLGAPHKLTFEQLDQLQEILLRHEPGDYHIPTTGSSWSGRAVKVLIRKLFKVKYNLNHCNRIRKRLGVFPGQPPFGAQEPRYLVPNPAHRKGRHAPAIQRIELVRLTPRENEILILLSKGEEPTTSREIAAELGISEGAVNFCIETLLCRFNAGSRRELVCLFSHKPWFERRPATTKSGDTPPMIP